MDALLTETFGFSYVHKRHLVTDSFSVTNWILSHQRHMDTSWQKRLYPKSFEFSIIIRDIWLYMSCDMCIQQCGILTSIVSDEPVHPPFKLGNSE